VSAIHSPNFEFLAEFRKPAAFKVYQPVDRKIATGWRGSTKFELVNNLKTAKAVGLTIQQSLLQRADEIIQ